VHETGPLAEPDPLRGWLAAAGDSHCASRQAGSIDAFPRSLLEVAVLWRVSRARNLLESGFTSDVCYCVVSGAVQLSCAGSDPRSAVVEVLGHGEWAGLECIQAGPVVFAAATLCESTLLVVRRSFLRSLFEQNCEVRQMLLAAMMNRYRAIGKRVAEASDLDAEQRVRRAFEMLATKYAQASGAGRRLPFQLTQSQIAYIAGTSRQSTNQAISRMKKDRTLAMVGRNYVLRSEMS
jgi:CRP-like cAMP-binding protein